MGFSVAQIRGAKDWSAETTQTYDWPSPDVAGPDGEPVGGNVCTCPVVSMGRTLVLLAGVCTAVVLGVHARVAVREGAATVYELGFAILTLPSVLTPAYVMNLSVQADTIGHFVAAAGAGPAFLSPALGWFGVAVSGSGTSANTLFGSLQVAAARESGPSPGLLAAANSSGGGLGKMTAPQNLTIACPGRGSRGPRGGSAAQGAVLEPRPAAGEVPDRAGTELAGPPLDAALTLPDLSPGSDLRLRLEVHSASARRAAIRYG